MLYLKNIDAEDRRQDARDYYRAVIARILGAKPYPTEPEQRSRSELEAEYKALYGKHWKWTLEQDLKAGK